jgi:adenine-specific DNA-methyltransferase
MELENLRMTLQAELDSKKTQAQRNKLGQFATPPALALEVVQTAIELLPKRERIHFLDPGFGTGSFYSALLQSVKRNRIASANGFEIDPHYGESARSIWKKEKLVLEIDDFTKRSPSPIHNLVVCNPPYVRHHHLDAGQKLYLQNAIFQATGLGLSGLSGLYCYFLLLSKLWMAPNGLGVWLIPSEFMDVNYGQTVKQFLCKQVTLERIHRFDPSEAQFEDALVSSAVVFLRNTPPQKTQVVRFTYGGGIVAPKTTSEVTVDELQATRKWTAIPRKKTTRPKVTNQTLGELFSIKRGLATGCNSFFMLSKDKAKDFPKEFLQPILPSPRDLETDEVKSDRSGCPIVSKQLFLFNCSLPEATIKSDYPLVWDYLKQGIELGVSERYLCKHRTPWYSQENRPSAPFLLTYMGRPSSKSELPFRFILNHSKATAANVYLLLYPKAPLLEILEQDTANLKAIWKGLNTITEQMFADEGRIYGGGLHKIEPKELSKVSADSVIASLGKKIQYHRQPLLFAE